MKSQRVLCACAACVMGSMFAAGGAAFAQSVTIATFADPSPGAVEPLFTIDLGADRIHGGWAKANSGLNLEVVQTATTYADVYFTLTDTGGADGISYVQSGFTGPSGGGIISFFDDSDALLLQIDFDGAFLTPGGLGADELISLDVVDIRGPALPFGGTYLTTESFGFAFANQVRLPGPLAEDPTDDIVTATASFTSSAVIPEPSVLALLAMGAITLAGRRHTR